MRIDAQGLYYKELNGLIHQAVESKKRTIILDNVNGQRYIGSGLSGDVKITIKGVPGNDLAAFMDGPTITVLGNGQDGISNSMNSGKVVIHGDAGDIVGYSMRGGRIYIKGDVGYRVGIHMKSYRDQLPLLIVGGMARDFFGEYMAGGILILLGLNKDAQPILGNYIGTGMHGGMIYIRGRVEEYQLGREAESFPLDKEDRNLLRKYLQEYSQVFSLDLKEILKEDFLKLLPRSSRPYGQIYAY
jgi:glutamate synthase domain-containing protein 3